MAILNCTMCGGHLEMTADRSIGICECCGSAITFPKVDDDQLAAAFNRGNHFRRMGEFDKALAVYERIVQQDDTEAEAHWCCALCRFGIEYVEDPASLEWIPTCHRASFDSFLEDVDYLAALKHSTGAKRIQYQKYAAKIAEVQRGILATSQNAEPFDVFICYKETDEQGQRTRDSLLAQDIYYQLTEQGRRVFFARITLEDIAGSQYEPYIFAALNSARVMVVVGTKPEHLNAVWVKNEWSRFLALMRKDHSRLLLPCYRDMDPYDLPEQLSVLQSYDMSKIGFIQDLIRGISKVLDAEKKPEPARETVVMQANSNVAALLKRGNMALEDGDWEKADSFYEEVLNQDPECAEAYIGKTLSEEKCRSLDAFVEKRLSLRKKITPQTLTIKAETARATELANQYKIHSYLSESTILELFSYDLSYSSEVESRKHQLQEEQNYWKNHKQLTRAIQFAKGDYTSTINRAKDRILTTLGGLVQQAEVAERETRESLQSAYAQHLLQAEAQAKERYQQACDARDTAYQKCIAKLDTTYTEKALEKLRNSFEDLDGYKDSSEYIKKCNERIAEAKAKAQEEQEAQRAKLAKKRKRVGITAFAALLSFALLITGIIHFDRKAKEKAAAEAIELKYHSAVEMMERGDYMDAIISFEELGDYRDSKSKIEEIYKALQSVSSLSAGGALSVGAKADGTVLITGDNVNEFFNQVRNWTDIVSVSAGASHVVGLRTDGIVVVAGHNNYRHMEEVSNWRDVIAISAGNGCTIGIKSDGSVISAGTGYGTTLSDWTNIKSVSVGSNHTVGLTFDRTVVATGSDPSACNVSGWTDIIAVAAGNDFTIGLKSDGTVISTNFNKIYTRPWTDIVAISAGDSFAVGLKSDGTVVATGSNASGQCNVQDWTDIVAISAGEQHTLGLKSDGTVVFAGRNAEKQGEVSDWKDVKIPD